VKSLAADHQADILEESRLAAVRLGSSYGGWTFDLRLLNASSIVYSVGIGTDMSFDLSLIKTIGCDVHAFDDTPASNGWLRGLQRAGKLPAQFHWHRSLLSGKDEVINMRLPNGHGVSYSAESVGSARGFKRGSHPAQALCIGTIMASLNHSRIDLLKIDIEASEFTIFNEMLLVSSSTPAVLRLPVCQLLLEFHSRLSPKGYEAKGDALVALQSLGFTLLHNAIRHGADDAFLMNPRFCIRARGVGRIIRGS